MRTRFFFLFVLTGMMALPLLTVAQPPPNQRLPQPEVMKKYTGQPLIPDNVIPWLFKYQSRQDLPDRTPPLPIDDATATAQAVPMALHATAFVIPPSGNTLSARGTAVLVNQKDKLALAHGTVTGPADGEITLLFPDYRGDPEKVERETYRKNGRIVRGKVIHQDTFRGLGVIELESIPASVVELPLAERGPTSAQPGFLIGAPLDGKLKWLYESVRIEPVLSPPAPETTVKISTLKTLRVLPVNISLDGAGPGPITSAGQLVGFSAGIAKGSRQIDAVDAAEIHTLLSDALRMRATELIAAKKYQEAIAWCDKALQYDPRDALTYNERGVAQSFLDKLELAERDYEHAVRLNPKMPRAWRNLGSVRYHLQKYPEAVGNFTQAIELAPDYARAYADRAKAYDKLGLADQAEQDRNMAAKLAAKAKMP